MTTGFLLVGEVAEELGLNHQSVLNRIKRGKIAGVKRRGIWVISRSELNRFKKNRDQSALVYYVYLHLTPEGKVFWVGKSKTGRLTDFNSGRHNFEYDKVLKKYGLSNIKFEVVKMGLSERDAGVLERETIESYRAKGHPLTNYVSIK